MTAVMEPVRLNEYIREWRRAPRALQGDPSYQWSIRHAILKWGAEHVTKDSPNANVELLDATLERVRAESDFNGGKWIQSSWRCESGMCFAGWAAHLAGAEWAYDIRPGEWDNPEIWGRAVNVIDPETGEEMPVWKYAERALRLGEWDAHALFDAVNDLEDIEDIVATIKEKAQVARHE